MDEFRSETYVVNRKMSAKGVVGTWEDATEEEKFLHVDSRLARLCFQDLRIVRIPVLQCPAIFAF